MRTSLDAFDAGFVTGVNRAKHDLSIAPMFAVQQSASEDYATHREPFERGHRQGYRETVYRWLNPRKRG
jgi:hypothetical protein